MREHAHLIYFSGAPLDQNVQYSKYGANYNFQRVATIFCRHHGCEQMGYTRVKQSDAYRLSEIPPTWVPPGFLKCGEDGQGPIIQ